MDTGRLHRLAEVGGAEQMKKITAVNIAAVILAMSLTACGSSEVENVPDEQDVSEIMENATENSAQDEDSDAAGEITSESETLDVLTFMPETCEDYIKLANAYLQMDDVMQALAVLDEGMEKLAVGGQGAESQGIDLLSQRKDYILAGTVAVRTEYTENEYDEEGEILIGYASECDENGNTIMFSYNNMESQSSTLHEYRYDVNGNEIEARYNSSSSYQTRTYDIFGNETEYAAYNSDGECTIKIIRDYNERGNLIREIRYDRDGKDAKSEYEYDENGSEIKMSYYIDGSTLTTWEEREYDENNNIVKYVEDTAGATKLVKGNGRVGICTSYSDRDCSYETYYFLDENGKKEISLRTDWDSEGEKSYCVYDDDSFTEYDISEGEYYDITDKMITLTDIDWQKLEDPNYGND